MTRYGIITSQEKGDIMKPKMNQELLNGLVLVAFGIGLYAVLSHLSLFLMIFIKILSIFSPFLIGLGIAFILNVPMNMIEKKLKLKNQHFKRGISLTTAILAVLCILFFVVALIIPDLGKTITSFVNEIPNMITNLENEMEELATNYPAIEKWSSKIDLNPEKIKSQFESWLEVFGTGILTTSFNVVVSIISGLANFIIAFIFAIYVLAEKEKLSKQFKILLRAFMKEKYVQSFFKITALANRTFSKFISGQCLEACILGMLCFIGMQFFKFPYALSISVLVALTALIPVFGAFIAMIIGFILISITSFSSAIWFLIFFLILQQLEGNLIYPRVVGNSVGLPAIWTMMAVTIGGSCFGILGMLISVPLSSILYALLKEYIQKKNQQKLIKKISYEGKV